MSVGVSGPTSGDAPAEPPYRLAEEAVDRRAFALAVTGAATAVAPAMLVVVLLVQLGLASKSIAGGVAIAILALGVARAVLAYDRARRRLASLAVQADAEALTVRVGRQVTRIPRAAIERIVEVEGAYGGLRVQVAAEGLPRRIEVPAGGESFGALRARIGELARIERARRRGAWGKVVLGGVVVLALFFAPFVVADVRGTRVAAIVVLLAAWGTARATIGRG
ncbi:MAG TPA: hypothetical protein VGI39_17625 [Polyangiaceae bacterium]